MTFLWATDLVRHGHEQDHADSPEPTPRAL
jgi:hypothetical protein